MSRKSNATKKKKSTVEEIPFGLDAIESYNAENSKVAPTNLEEAESDDDEEVLDLDLSEDEYDFGEDDQEGEDNEDEGEEDGGDGEDEEAEENGFEFDEDAYDRKEKLKQLDEEDADVLGVRVKHLVPAAPKLDWDRRDLHGDVDPEGKGKNWDKDLEEAKKQQAEKAAGLRDEDFEIDTAIVKSKSKKTKEHKMLDAMNADLDAIDLGEPQVEKLDKKITAQDVVTSVQEKLARIKKESPELLTMLKEFKEKVHEVNNVIVPILEKVKKNAIPTSEGISFLETKHQLLLSYCINISFYLMLKAQGAQVKDHPVIDQLVRIRAIIDKLKPIEKKLSYQIDKLVRSANLGTVAGGDETLTEKANPADLVEDSDEETAGLNLYKAPKISEEAMETTELKTKEKDRKRRVEMKRRQMAEFMESEYGDKPEESTQVAADAWERTTQEKDVDEREEAAFRRTEITKAEKKKYQKRIESQNDVLAGLGDYSDMAVFDDDLGQKKKDEEYLTRKRMRAQMDLIDNRQRAKKQALSADSDTLPVPKKNRNSGPGLGRGLLFDDDVEVDSADEVDERRPRFTEGGVPLPEQELEAGAKRKAAKRIEENRGLVRIRNKDVKTPHLRYKRAYARKVGQMGGIHKMRAQGKPYSGERHIQKDKSRSKMYSS